MIPRLLNMRALVHARGFTLMEMMVVIAIISTLAGLLLPALSKGKHTATKVQCMEQLRQLDLAMTMYVDDHRGLLPPAHSVVPWNATNPRPWTRLLLPYYSTTNILRCPDFSRVYHKSPYSYFMGSRAAFIGAGGQAASLVWLRIQWPAQYILSGDTNFPFLPEDADPDNYTQDTLFGADSPAHGGRVNVLFSDGHVQSARCFDRASMTYSYHQVGVNWEF